jgi:AcrR family transcriptional regulator
MKRGEDGRNRIVEAGLRLAASEGLAAINAQRIAKELGRERGGIVYHFPNRSTLLDAIVAAALDKRDVRVLAALIIAQHAGVAGMSVADRQSVLMAAASHTERG